MRKFIILAAAPLMFAGVLTAQNHPSAESGPTIRTTVNEVLLDLIVRDKHGKVVKNLKPTEVEIYEDGVRQQILNLRLVAGPDLREEPSAQGGQTAPAKVAALRTPLRAANLVCIVFHNLDSSTRQWTMEAVQEFLKNQLPPDTLVGVFNLTDRLVSLYPFTSNREELLLAAREGFTGRPAEFASASQRILSANPTLAYVTTSVNNNVATTSLVVSGGEIDNRVVGGADLATGDAPNAVRGDVVATRRQFSHIEGMRQTDQLITMIRQLGTLPGRKTVLLMSSGLTTTGDPDRFQKIVDEANQVGITVYSVDTHGLSQNSTSLAANTALSHVVALSQGQQPTDQPAGAAGMMEEMRQDDYTRQAVRTSDTQASLRALAEQTGGFLIANTNDLRKPFQRVVEDVDTHYEAAYRPASNTYDGRFRKIEVKLTRPDLTVENRSGYFAVPDNAGSGPLTPSEIAGLMALNAQPRPHAFDFLSRAYHFQPEGTEGQYAMAYEVPVANLTAISQPGLKKHRLHVSVLSLVKDASGQIVDRYSQDSPYEVPDDKMAALKAESATYTHVFSLPAGRYTVETAVLDREGNRATTNTVEIDNPARKGIGMSSVVLVKRVESATGPPEPSDPFRFETNRVVPELGTKLSRKAKPYVYFVVYPDKASVENPRIQVQFVLNGKVLAKQAADLPPANASGAIPMVIAAAAKPGECELRITAIQGNESLERSVKYTVAAE
jgi:VWFA-related protein